MTANNGLFLYEEYLAGKAGRSADEKMNRSTFTAYATIIGAVIAAIAAFCVVELWASNTVLRKIRLVQPGTHIGSITNQLGPMWDPITNIDFMTRRGSITNPSFCKDKKLYRFYAATPPCRELDVYTDTNDVVVYVTWQGL